MRRHAENTRVVLNPWSPCVIANCDNRYITYYDTVYAILRVSDTDARAFNAATHSLSVHARRYFSRSVLLGERLAERGFRARCRLALHHGLAGRPADRRSWRR